MDGYSIGQVSNILQMPRQTIRFLEERGLVNPQRNLANSYRRYSLEDVAHLIDYRWYRDAGYSLQESVDAIVGYDLDLSVEKMQVMQIKAEAEANRQALIAQRLQSYAAKLDRNKLASCIGVCEIAESPEMYWCINAIAQNNKVKYKSAAQLKGWFDMVLKHYCFMSHVFCIYAESLRDTRMNYGVTWGYGIEATWIQELGLLPNAEATRIPSSKSVHTMLRLELGESAVDAARKTVVPFLQDEGYSLAGDVWGNELLTIVENGTHASYVEIWAPCSK